MFGRKKKDDLELEKEFTTYKTIHMYSIICGALIVFEDEGIYDHYLLKGKYETKEEDGESKAKEIATNLMQEYEKGNTQEFVELYNYCWSVLCPLLEEHQNLRAKA